MECITSSVLILLVIIGTLTLPELGLAQDESVPSKETLLALSALEGLHAKLTGRADVTLDEIVMEAARTVYLPENRARTTLAMLIGKATSDSKVEGDSLKVKKEIEQRAATLSGVEPDTLSLFVTELLTLTQAFLEGGENPFMDEILGEAADAVNLDENKGNNLARTLVYYAAKRLRPLPRKEIKQIPRAAYVLAVNLQASDRSIDDRKMKSWSKKTIRTGTSYIAEKLSKSMTMSRRFRRIVPSYNIVDSKNLMADYLLVLHVESETWDWVKDTRERAERDPDELLVSKKRKSYWERKREGKVYEITVELEERIEMLPDGEKVWSDHATLKRYVDELSRTVKQDETFIARGEWKIYESSVRHGIWDLVTRQAIRDFTKLK